MDRVTVTVPARLHLGFLDLNGGLGRKFGSLGLSIEEPVTTLVASRAAAPSVRGPEADRVARCLAEITRHLNLDSRIAIDVIETIPGHSGLGSGTQLALAVAAAVRTLNGLDLDPAGDATVLGRGARSGVGIGLFTSGGFAVDGGRGSTPAPAPVVARLPFPEAWRVILIFDHSHHGVHGAEELTAFAKLPPFPESAAAELARLTLMQILPALAEEDLSGFGQGIAAIQRILGDHFAAAQGGRFTSPAVAKAAQALAARGAHGVGQSSWGPTGFAFAPSEAAAREIVAGAQAPEGLDLRIVRGNNRPARIEKYKKASVA